MTVLRSLGVSPEDLKGLRTRPSAPTFAEYVPRVYAALPATLTRDAYGAVAHAAGPLEPDRGLAVGVAVLVERISVIGMPRHHVGDRVGVGSNVEVGIAPDGVYAGIRRVYHRVTAKRSNDCLKP
jgi:hypothetical protein